MSDVSAGGISGSAQRASRVWALLLVVSAVGIGAADAVLLQLGGGFFAGGFNGVSIHGLELAAYALTSMIFDLWWLLLVWALLVPVSRRLGLSRLQGSAMALVVGVSVPLGLAFVRYRLHHVLGDLTGLSLLWDVADHSSAEVASQAVGYLPPLAVPVVLATLALLLGLALAPRLEAKLGLRFETPAIRSVGLGAALLGVLGCALLVAPAASVENLRFGLRKKPSATLLAALGGWLTDFDRDGFGPFSRLRDPAPWDPAIHPYALDLPGNDVDENGLAGDHPLHFAPYAPVAVPSDVVPASPHVLLIFLESFRADLVGLSFQGREVTPFLNRLAREGAASERAYVHAPFTSESRAQLFGGHILPRAGDPTLVDDFGGRGYRVGLFSGQDDSFANGVAQMGAMRADVFYDARADRDRRVSRSSSPVGLQVSWKLVVQRVEEFLATADGSVPLFLYVNIVDTHHPYHHREIDLIFDVDPVARYEIRRDRADDVWATYLNTAANVDRAVERVVRAWWSRMGSRGVILVTADHGQSLYDDEGFLGHGRSVHQTQTRVPFILWGIGGDWPEPLGLADVRGLLLRHLPRPGNAVSRARFVPDPSRRLFHFMARIDEPRILGLRGIDGTVQYDFENDQVELRDGYEHPLEAPAEVVEAAFESLIWNWEELRLRHADERVSPEHP
jgi:hypothetical protein